MSDKAKEIAIQLAPAVATFVNTSGEEITTVQLRIYIQALMPYDLEAIRFACSEVIRTHKYKSWPLPALFIAFIEPSLEVRAEYALMKVQEMINRYGSYFSVAFKDDPLIHCVIRSYGGWPELCYIYEDTKGTAQHSFFRKEFIAKYISYMQMPEVYGIPPMFLGRNDRMYETVSTPKELPPPTVKLSRGVPPQAINFINKKIDRAKEAEENSV